MKRVRKNATREIKRILNTFSTVKEYTLENGFVPTKFALTDEKKDTLFADIFLGSAKLYKNNDKWYTVHYHSNHWIDLHPKEEASCND